jgi:hypothetical protein
MAAFVSGSSGPPAACASGRKDLNPGPALFVSFVKRKVPSQKRLRPTDVSGCPSTASSRPPWSFVCSTHFTIIMRGRGSA